MHEILLIKPVRQPTIPAKFDHAGRHLFVLVFCLFVLQSSYALIYSLVIKSKSGYESGLVSSLTLP
jgi:hypothetical protein